jgi:hypothetical protein
MSYLSTDSKPLQRIRGLRALRQLWRPLFRGISGRQVRILLQQRTLVRKLKGGQLQRARDSLCARERGTPGSTREGG